MRLDLVGYGFTTARPHDGELGNSSRWAAWFDGLGLTNSSDGTTILLRR
jgi:hypothetical protein